MHFACIFCTFLVGGQIHRVPMHPPPPSPQPGCLYSGQSWLADVLELSMDGGRGDAFKGVIHCVRTAGQFYTQKASC